MKEFLLDIHHGRAYKIFNLRTRKVIESINVSFDDGKITGINEDDHERLSFRNKDFESNTDDSIPDESTPDRPNTDDPNSDNQEDSNATVEGEQQHDQSVDDQHQQSGDPNSEKSRIIKFMMLH